MTTWNPEGLQEVHAAPASRTGGRFYWHLSLRNYRDSMTEPGKKYRTLQTPSAAPLVTEYRTADHK